MEHADVMVVEDEPLVREVVARYLEREGYRVREVSDGDMARTEFRRRPADLVILDIMLPGADGLTLLREFGARRETAVILLSARSDETDRIVGLELGADDYVVKPFSPRELVARTRSVLRRRLEPEPPPQEFVGLRIDTRTREASVDGRVIDLTVKEFDLLTALASEPRRVFSKSQLLDIVWSSSEDWQDPATVTVHVGRIRNKLRTFADGRGWIDTVRGVGYRFEPAPQRPA